MDSGEPSSSRGQMPTLPEGVRPCEGIPRESWSTRVVILTNEAGEDVARAICRSVDASVVVDTNMTIFSKLRLFADFETECLLLKNSF